MNSYSLRVLPRPLSRRGKSHTVPGPGSTLEKQRQVDRFGIGAVVHLLIVGRTVTGIPTVLLRIPASSPMMLRLSEKWLQKSIAPVEVSQHLQPEVCSFASEGKDWLIVRGRCSTDIGRGHCCRTEIIWEQANVREASQRKRSHDTWVANQPQPGLEQSC